MLAGELTIKLLILLFHLIIILGGLGIIVYLIVKRIQEKERETFDKRDN